METCVKNFSLANPAILFMLRRPVLGIINTVIVLHVFYLGYGDLREELWRPSPPRNSN